MEITSTPLSKVNVESHHKIGKCQKHIQKFK